MNYLLMILLIVSCGKPVTHDSSNIYQHDPLSLDIDSDGDGMTDWQEVHQNRDPFVADVEFSLPPITDEVTLLDEFEREFQFSIKPIRLLREESLKEGIQPKGRSISHGTNIVFDFNHEQVIWDLLLKNQKLKSYRDPSDKDRSIKKLNSSFQEDRKLTLSSKPTPLQLERLQKKNYRLIISYPEKDYVYYVSTKISPRDFLAKRHLFQMDTHKNTLQIDQKEDYPYILNPWSLHSETLIWRSIGIHQMLPQVGVAGETYGFVFGKVEDFKRSILSGLDAKTSDEIIVSISHLQFFELTINIPALPEVIIESKQDKLVLAEIDNNPIYCYFTNNRVLQTKNKIISNPQEILSLVDSNQLTDVKTNWFTHGPKGSAINISGFMLPGHFEHKLTFGKMLKIGLTQSNCPWVKVSYSHKFQYDHYFGQFNWQ
jgi:hypothetical protein